MNADGIANVSLLRDIKSIIDESKRSLTRNINLTMIHAYWSIGKRIVEEEQNGSAKAKYGKELLKSISKELTKQYGKGFSQTNIFMMRRLYCEYPKFQTLSEKLSWSHYLILLTIKDLHVRSFYYHECENANWSVRELDRQISSGLYERLLLSKGDVNKQALLDLAKKGVVYDSPDSFIKDPMVLEFVGVSEKPFLESDLEKAITDHIEEFLLELGRGFMFVGTQQRISIAGMNYYVDMVFYNKILKSYVLIDLKMNKLKPENVGQMNLYVNYYKTEINDEGDQNPIGIILCAQKEEALAQMSILGIENNIYAARYTTVMPDIELLQAEVERVVLEYGKTKK